jgi:hypothetical protein
MTTRRFRVNLGTLGKSKKKKGRTREAKGKQRETRVNIEKLG